MIAARLREVSEADTALIILPSVGDAWACEIADGYRASSLIGLVFPPDGRAMTVLEEGAGLIVDSLTRLRTLRLPELAQFGPALYAPMMLRGEGCGNIQGYLFSRPVASCRIAGLLENRTSQAA